MVRIQNIPEETQEDLRDVIGEALASTIGMDKEELIDEMDQVYRVTSRYTRENKLPREVHVRFNKKRVRDMVLKETREKETCILKERRKYVF